MPHLLPYFIKTIDNAKSIQKANGSMPPGCNGPYKDPETPVRNTSHFVIAFLKAWELTGDRSYYESAEKCLHYLLYNNPFRTQFTYQHRYKIGKDRCNGLIGPAWNIEALVYAYQKMGCLKAKDLARDLFLMHPFDEKKCIWRSLEPDGKILNYDSTFNHQLWFAAAVSPLSEECYKVKLRINKFLNALNTNWKIDKNGRIKHPLLIGHRQLRDQAKRIYNKKYEHCIRLKEIGYQAFNLYAFVLLCESGISWPKAVHEKVRITVNYLENREYLQNIEKSVYGFSYNPPGWEIAVVLSRLGNGNMKTILNWLDRQIKFNSDLNKVKLNNSIIDTATHNARTYELARLPNHYFYYGIKEYAQI